MNNLSSSPGDYLDLNMSRIVQELFQIEFRMAEGSPRLGSSALKGPSQFTRCPKNTHASPASSKGGLDQYGKDHTTCLIFSLVRAGSLTFRTGNRGYAASSCRFS